eukprot:Hpha_TRINITY_DN11253_c0_g1::TRINITY_DN11253_c0_g1_i1::g.167442::m.167442
MYGRLRYREDMQRVGFRTQLCSYFEMGYCRKGNRCRYAHGAAQLLSPRCPTVQMEVCLFPADWFKKLPPWLKRRARCLLMVFGRRNLVLPGQRESVLGFILTFAYTWPDQGTLRRDKTQLCIFFQDGRCKKGNHCSFAHGVQELSPIPLCNGLNY